MCLNKYPNCKNKISFLSVLGNAMFSVTQEPIKCDNCEEDTKLNFSKSIALAMIPQLFIIPVMNTFDLSVLEAITYAVIHIFISTAILVCFTSFNLQSNDVSKNNSGK